MPNYTKLFNSIVTSTIWTEDDKTRILWITMLALADQNGEVHASLPGLARLAGVRIEDAEIGINKFLEPDAYSRTPDNEGRRIAKIDGGWEILNHAKYRRMASIADKREATMQRQRRFRDRNASVTHSNAAVTQETYKAEAEAEAEEILPPNPQGGRGSGPPKKLDNIPTTPQAQRIASLYHRRPTTRWTDREVKAYKKLGQIDPEDLETVCRYTEAERAKGDDGRHRRDLLTFLNNFTGELDRAREKPINAQHAPKQIQFID